MKEIELNKKNKTKNYRKFVAIVDDEDFEYLNNFQWYANKLSNTYYAMEVKSLKSMHRFIMNAKEGQIIDHKDRNGLNNQKSNLRFCTRTQNQTNRRACGCCKYLGVTFVRPNTKYISKKTGKLIIYHIKPKYRAAITVNKKYMHLGLFETQIEAAKAYNEAAIKYHGEFANLNKFD